MKNKSDLWNLLSALLCKLLQLEHQMEQFPLRAGEHRAPVEEQRYPAFLLFDPLKQMERQTHKQKITLRNYGKDSFIQYYQEAVHCLDFMLCPSLHRVRVYTWLKEIFGRRNKDYRAKYNSYPGNGYCSTHVICSLFLHSNFSYKSFRFHIY